MMGAGEEKVGMPLPPFGDREATDATRLGGVVGGRKAWVQFDSRAATKAKPRNNVVTRPRAERPVGVDNREGR